MLRHAEGDEGREGIWLVGLRPSAPQRYRWADGLGGDRTPSATSRALHWIVSYAWKPVLYADGIAYLRYMNEVVTTATMPYRSYHRLRSSEEAEKIPSYAVVTRILHPVVERVHASVDETKAQSALAQVLLAAQQYKTATGAYPDSLKQLRAGIPEDPFSGKDLIYRRTAGGFQAYSIGRNLRDDGGLNPKGNPDAYKGDRVLYWPR